MKSDDSTPRGGEQAFIKIKKSDDFFDFLESNLKTKPGTLRIV